MARPAVLTYDDLALPCGGVYKFYTIKPTGCENSLGYGGDPVWLDLCIGDRVFYHMGERIEGRCVNSVDTADPIGLCSDCRAAKGL